MSLLSVVRRACLLTELIPPTAVLTSPDLGVQQMRELAFLDAEELAAKVDWDALTGTHSFSAVSAVAQTSGMPADFGRFTFGGQVWNGTLNGPVAGPASSSEWANALAWQSPAVAQRFRISGGKLQMIGARLGDTISFPYITNRIYADKAGTPKAAMDADDDEFRVPDKLVVLGLIWRWKQTKGFDYAEDMRSAEREIERASSADGGGLGIVSFASRPTFSGGETAYPGALGP